MRERRCVFLYKQRDDAFFFLCFFPSRKQQVDAREAEEGGAGVLHSLSILFGSGVACVKMHLKRKVEIELAKEAGEPVPAYGHQPPPQKNARTRTEEEVPESRGGAHNGVRVPPPALPPPAAPLPPLPPLPPPHAQEEVEVAQEVQVFLVGHKRRKEGKAALHAGVALELRREPDNKHDRNAVAVYVTGSSGRRVQCGYVMATQAEVLAPALDAGEMVIEPGSVFLVRTNDDVDSAAALEVRVRLALGDGFANTAGTRRRHHQLADEALRLLRLPFYPPDDVGSFPSPPWDPPPPPPPPRVPPPPPSPTLTTGAGG